MKTQICLLLLLATSTSHAKNIKKEPPVVATHVATLQEVGINYLNFAPHSEIKLTLLKYGEIPKYLEFSETFFTPGACFEDFCPAPPTHIKRYKIAQVKSTQCGTKLVANENIDKPSKPISKLILLDYSLSMCDIDINGIWQVTLKNPDAPIRKFQGTPTRIPAKVDCSNVGKETVCTMHIAPATCLVKAWDGVALNPALSATGGNSCLAESNLRVAACERGLNYEKLDRQDVRCMTTFCPMPMCAAPPEGCEYKVESKLGANGCPAYPCGVLICH